MYHDQMDPDVLQSKLERLGKRVSDLHKRGICCHGWNQTRKNGTCVCLHCNKVFASFDALCEARSELL